MQLQRHQQLISMDQEKVRYIFQYFSNLLTDNEKAASLHSVLSSKLEQYPSADKEAKYRKKGWLTDDPTVLNLLKDGFIQFELATATRIMKESADQVFLTTVQNAVNWQERHKQDSAVTADIAGIIRKKLCLTGTAHSRLQDGRFFCRVIL